jgi:hypothetical protein
MLSEHIRYLRDKAAQFRVVARNLPPGLAQQLLDLADEFEAKAAEIEAGEGGKRVN